MALLGCKQGNDVKTEFQNCTVGIRSFRLQDVLPTSRFAYTKVDRLHDLRCFAYTEVDSPTTEYRGVK